MTEPQEKTVLVVDDEPDIRMVMQTALEDEGFNVLTAADGDEALDCMKRNTIDFISLDLVMPRHSGIKFFHELRRNKQWSKVPVIVVTGHARDEVGGKDFDELFAGKTMTGPETYLEKPIRPESFVAAVKRALDIEDNAPPPETTSSPKVEIEQMLETADPVTLEKIRAMLRAQSK